MEILVGLGVGLFAGFISGLVGVGGGTIIIPILVLGLGYSQHEAQGTALMAFAFPIFAAATWNYYRFGRVRWRLAIGMSIALAITSYLAAQWVQSIDSQKLKQIFGVFLVIMAVYVFWKSFHPIEAKPAPQSPKREFVIGLIVGALTGIIKGLTGLGGGVIIVPLLLLLAKIDQHTAQGTSLLTMTLPVAFMAAIPYWQHGHVRWMLVWGLLGGILIGSFLSSKWAQKLRGPLLAQIFAITIGIMGILLLLR
ncbi:MAG: sulfite exporter TauE/SafE family protein [Bacteroidia bacterium]|nr:sulfite exporter TauE/SafE family protein [Bacteroidia bacterium]MCX7651714.1 sulfite exporter TauE/SafE family protein [Bacteroidia bacterium]MDW8417446.1 sulfite exporter TauE/SafE family protein [Bacteroidia bacterium]